MALLTRLIKSLPFDGVFTMRLEFCTSEKVREKYESEEQKHFCGHQKYFSQCPASFHSLQTLGLICIFLTLSKKNVFSTLFGKQMLNNRCHHIPFHYTFLCIFTHWQKASHQKTEEASNSQFDSHNNFDTIILFVSDNIKKDK